MLEESAAKFLGWRKRTWELRIATGVLFGIASGWFLYPRFMPTARDPAPVTYVRSRAA